MTADGQRQVHRPERQEFEVVSRFRRRLRSHVRLSYPAWSDASTVSLFVAVESSDGEEIVPLSARAELNVHVAAWRRVVRAAE